MLPINFEGAREIGKPRGMTDEECSSLMIRQGFTNRPGYLPRDVLQGVFEGTQWPYTVSCWQPSKEDKEAVAEGRPVWVRFLSHTVFPMEVFTLDAQGQIN